MSSNERRQYQRVKCNGGTVTLGASDITESKGVIIDISQSGMFIKSTDPATSPPTNSGKMFIHPKRFRTFSISGTIVRQGCDERGILWCAIKFDSLLSEAQLSNFAGRIALGALSDSSYDLAKSDYNEIMQQIREIKSCRSNIFIWTIGFTMTAVLAIWTTALSGKVTMPALTAAMFIILFAFVIGILSVIEKGRSIMLRQGLVAVLQDYLKSMKGPSLYKGWSHLRNSFDECGCVRDIGACPRKIGPNGASCRDDGEYFAVSLNSAKKPFPGTLDSFMTLCLSIFSAIYLVLITIIGFTIARWISEMSLFSNASAENIHYRVLSMYGIGLFLSGILWRSRAIIFAIAAILPISILAGVAFPEKSLYLGSVCLLGILFGSLGLYLMRQISHLIRGKYSFLAYYFAWHRIIENCCSINEAIRGERIHAFRGLTKLWIDLYNWILAIDPHKKKLEKYKKKILAESEEI